MRVYELRALRRLPAASMLPAGSRRPPPECTTSTTFMCISCTQRSSTRDRMWIALLATHLFLDDRHIPPSACG